MKKLMKMMSAVAVAFGLHAIGMADDITTGTSFEGITIPPGGSSVPLTIDDGTGELVAPGEGCYWATNETSTLTVMEGFSNDEMRPDQFAEAPSQSRYLSIKTTLGNPVTRYVAADETAAPIGSAGFYFDSLVKFTAFDTDPTSLFAVEDSKTVITNGGKIAIWLKEEYATRDGEEVPVATNLMVTAGYLTGDGVVATNYQCIVVGDDVNINDGGWHRVTVRAVGSIYESGTTVPGFVVYIDECYVASLGNSTKGIDSTRVESSVSGLYLEKALFPSAVQGDDEDKSVIKAVDLDGQGDVDDIVFTSTKPKFVKDVDLFVVDLCEGVASVEYTLYKDSVVKDSGTLTSRHAFVFDDGIYVTLGDISYAPGYKEDGIATNGYVTVDGDTYTPVVGNTGIEIKAKQLGATVVYVESGDITTNECETLEEAFEFIKNDFSGGSATVTLKTTAFDGIELDNEYANIVLDLAGNDITNVNKEAAITITAGSLTIVNSTVEIGHVVGNGLSGSDEAVIAHTGTTLAIDGGIYDGVVFHDDEDEANFEITGGEFEAAPNEDQSYNAIEFLVAAVKAGLGSTYTLIKEDDYYVITTATTCTLTFISGADGATTNEVEVSVGDAVEPPTAATVTGKGFYEWDPAVVSPAAGDATYTAMYTNAEYTITYLNGDGTQFTEWADYEPTTSYDIDDDVVLPKASDVQLSDTGVTLGGWTNALGEAAADWYAGEQTGDKTFYAKLDPIVPPEPETYDAGSVTNCGTAEAATILASLINANRSTMIKVPAGIDNTEGAYTGLFYAYVDGTSVVIDFTTEAAGAQAVLVTNKTVTIALSTLATAAEEQEVEFTGLTPGVWYSISEGTALTDMAEGDRVMANAEGKATLTFTTYGGTSGFYQMLAHAGDKPTPVPNEDPEPNQD